MKPLHEQEVESAKQTVGETGRDPGNFDFAVVFMEPDPDGGGMYTVRYEVTVTNSGSGRTASYIGGIGLDWVGAFAEDLNAGDYD